MPTPPARVSMFASLSDEDLMAMLHRQADACVKVVSLPDAARHAIGAKGNCSPEQAGTMNAVFALLAEREADRRGLLTAQIDP